MQLTQHSVSLHAIHKMSHINRIHTLLAVQSIVIIFASINRLSNLAGGYVAPNQFLRWVDFNNMLVFPTISIIAFYLLKRVIEQGSGNILLGSLFLLGVYLLGVSYGDHEVTNYLHTRFCSDDAGDLCRIIIFNDDQFSHWLFFGGFISLHVALLLIQALTPLDDALTRRDVGLIVVNSLFIALGIFANLGFEEIGFDLYVIVWLAILAVGLLWRFGRKPLLIYYTTAYCARPWTGRHLSSIFCVAAKAYRHARLQTRKQPCLYFTKKDTRLFTAIRKRRSVKRSQKHSLHWKMLCGSATARSVLVVD